ncbi:AAA family ATPase [Candidatus Dojkabacteria bacterium]|nr:AAA family ATPase [Candidatus Dojkabacteria bacterium]
MIVSILGPSGSGKDTQAKLLVDRYNLINISTGRLMREEIDKATKTGQIIDSYISKGKWVPDNITFELLKHNLPKSKNEQGYVLNGFPRTEAQIFLLDDLLKKREEALDAVIHFMLDDEEVMRRMRKQADEEEERSDLQTKIMKQRLLSYKLTIKPVLSEYKSRGKLIQVDASPSIEEVNKSIMEKIKDIK